MIKDGEVRKVKPHFGEDCKLNGGIIQEHLMSPRKGWALIRCRTCGKDVQVAYVPSTGGHITRFYVQGDRRFPRDPGPRLIPVEDE